MSVLTYYVDYDESYCIVSDASLLKRSAKKRVFHPG